MRRRSRMVEAAGTRFHLAELGSGDDLPLLLLHGGPGLDHHVFGDYLDPLAERGRRVIYLDLRAQGGSDPSPVETWTLPRMAEDVRAVARAMGLKRYAVLGHSYGALVALQNAVDFSGEAAATIVSSGFPSARYLTHIEASLEAFEPAVLRERVAASWEQESRVRTPQEVAQLLHDQMPFHFADPLDPRIEEYERRIAGSIYSSEVLWHFAAGEYGGIEVEDRLGEVTQPVLVLAGRHDRVCSMDAAEAIARGVPDAELIVFEESGHATFVEETDAYLEAVDGFLTRRLG